MINLKNEENQDANYHIAVLFNRDLQDAIKNPFAAFFKQESEITSDMFDCIIDAMEQDKIKIKVKNWDDEGLVFVEESSKELALQQMLSVMLDEATVDMDWWDLIQIWKLGTNFASCEDSLEGLKENLNQWCIDQIGAQSEKMIVFLQGDISLTDLNDIVNLVDNALHVISSNKTMCFGLKYIENQKNIRISAWYH